MKLPLFAILAFTSLAMAAEPAPTNTGKEIIELPRQTLTFKPSRDDLTVDKVVLTIHCAKPEEVLLNGVKPDPAWGDVHLTETGFAVDRRNTVPSKELWMYVGLPRVAKGQFELAPLKIEIPKAESRSLFCMSVKVWFKEVSNKYDSLFYEKLDDRYALVSFCTGGLDTSESNARFKQNRVATAGEFKDALAKPFVIKLNQQPLKPEYAQ